MDKIDKAKGSLLAGAIGDALGFEIELDSLEKIYQKYGEDGIQNYRLYDKEAIISDDTQLTLYTAEALIYNDDEINLLRDIHSHYLDWLKTQLKVLMPNNNFENPNISKIQHIEGINDIREPGMTCIYSLMNRKIGSMEKPLNDSKGCGGLMKNAPVGIYYGARSDKNILDIAEISAQIAAMTHGHPLAYIPVYCMTDIIVRIFREDRDLEEMIIDAIEDTDMRFCKSKYIDYFTDLSKKAIRLAKKTDNKDIDNIINLGQGWVAEETLAIAIYSSIKYKNDIIKAIKTAVNHGGDSDSTGAVTGNILGVYLGEKSIPKEFIEPLENRYLIEEIAEKLII
ncbi:MAG: ADP-ribosylglycohydrolase family protein [Andreesenia angusta]|nr:ADP-ribosylglycohydrolase family protein [Andreesenia angusta]